MPTKLNNKLLKIIEFNNKCIIPISNSLVGMMLLGFLSLFATNATALSITVDTTARSFDVIPGKFNQSAPIIATVDGSDATGGYTLSISGPTNTNANGKLLVDGTSNDGALDSIADDKTYTNFIEGEWGWKHCNNTTTCTMNTTDNYKKYPNTGTEIDKTSTTGGTAVQYAVVVGAKPTSTATPSTTYSGNFTMTLTASATPYSIGYVDPLANWPTTTAGTTTNTVVTLSDLAPTKDGYEFKGWCTEVPGSNGSCSGTTYQPGASYDLSNGATANLYAMWRFNGCDNLSYCMQEIDSWKGELSSAGSTKVATDGRDGKTYTVGKLADGNIWMLDNLDLGSTSTIVLTPNDTHIASYFALPASTTTDFTSGVNGWTQPKINIDSRTVVPSDATSTTGGYKVGVYYNYCAASAGTVCAKSGEGKDDATYDICPKGWRLPTGGAGGEFQTLYNNSSYNTYTKIRGGLHLPLSGHFRGEPESQGSGGYFWSSTRSGGYSMYHLILNSNNSANPLGNNLNRYYGLSVRCVAQ